MLLAAEMVAAAAEAQEWGTSWSDSSSAVLMQVLKLRPNIPQVTRAVFLDMAIKHALHGHSPHHSAVPVSAGHHARTCQFNLPGGLSALSAAVLEVCKAADVTSCCVSRTVPIAAWPACPGCFPRHINAR